VPNLVAVELRRHLRDHVAEGILFRGLRGAEMLTRDQFYSSAWKPALRGAGLAENRFKFHSCRHWCASTLLAEGAPITAVAGHLGDTVADGEPYLRPLASRRPGRSRGRARPGARAN
jgi:integrase